MGLAKAFSYYGRLDGHPVRDFINDFIKDGKSMMQTELREMEERIRRHVTETKREIIDEVNSIFSDFKEKSNHPKKEIKDVRFKRSIKPNSK